MIEQEKLEEIMNDSKIPFQKKDFDYKMNALTLLRERIPYGVCRSIIDGAEHDKVYLCSVEDILPYINEEDANALVEYNLFIDTASDCLAMYV